MREALREGEEDLKALRASGQESHEKRTQIEVDLVRKQAELKFLDETSRKELNSPVAELAAPTIPSPATRPSRRPQECDDVRNRIESLGR